MVCLGNICRSPLAEGILKDKIEKAGLQWEVDSAGTNAYNPGCPPHRFSQKAANKHDIDISTQKCRQFTKADLTDFNRIYVMDKQNYYAVKEIAGEKWDRDKVDFLLNEIYTGQNKAVPDPFSEGKEEFYKVYEMIEEACDAIVACRLKDEADSEGRRVKLI